jgi:hypothetical protein
MWQNSCYGTLLFTTTATTSVFTQHCFSLRLMSLTTVIIKFGLYIFLGTQSVADSLETQIALEDW